ncbi:MAG: hypothetical protein M1827_002952 [Pycnora praestabilis]|nr:MAG: hypothetical protein M1827_002952 [Pycnora praestabilis]
MSEGLMVQAVDTSSKGNSIWKSVGYPFLRQNITRLSVETNDLPGDSITYSRADWLALGNIDEGHVLPFEVEQQLVDDLASLAAAAVEDEAKCISAVVVEEGVDEQPGLTIRLATNQIIPEHVCPTFRSIFSLLQECAARDLSRSTCTAKVFDLVMILSRERIHSRLRSTRSKARRVGISKQNPSKPLTERLKNAAASLTGLQVSKDVKTKMRTLRRQADALHSTYLQMEKSTLANEMDYLKSLVKQAYELSHFDDRTSLESTLKTYNIPFVDETTRKAVREVDKLSRYWRTCNSMTTMSRSYRSLFSSIRLAPPLVPYDVQLWPRGPPCPGQKRHVHAEIQMLVYYELLPPLPIHSLQPRIIGVSKDACYLCDLFLKQHKKFYVSKTHGRLYQQWTVPDLCTYSLEQRDRFRNILVAVNKEIVRATKVAKKGDKTRKNRPYPMQSSIWQGAVTLRKPSTSTIRTLVSPTAADERQTSFEEVATDGAVAATPETRQQIETSTSSGVDEKPGRGANSVSATSAIPSSSTSQNSNLTLVLPDVSLPSGKRVIQRITKDTPFRTQLGPFGLHFAFDDSSPASLTRPDEADCVESEGRFSQGMIMLERVARGEKEVEGALHDVSCMKAGEEISLDRDIGADSVAMFLACGDDGVLEVTCRWTE